MKKILIVTTFNNHFHFFERFARAIKKLSYEVHFLTNRHSIEKEFNLPQENLFLLKWDNKTDKNFNIDLENSFEVAAGLISLRKARGIVNSVSSTVKRLYERHNYEVILMWSGVRLIEYTIQGFAIQNNIATLFFELGNFPGKLFVDPQGANAKSLLANQPAILEKFETDRQKFDDWKTNYVTTNLTEHKVPQSSSVGRVDYLKNIYDLIGFKAKNYVQYEPLITKEKLLGKYLRNIIKIKYDEIDLEKVDYIFFPMQVNKDAQLILNSEIGNLSALTLAAQKAKAENKRLLVKPHPAEVEYGFIKKVNDLKIEFGFSFVNSNTMQLINNADEVITINSTVGLQAMLFGKKVTCLGKAFYDGYSDEQLAKYINSYLLDIEFWDDSEISQSQVEEILSRIKLGKEKV